MSVNFAVVIDDKKNTFAAYHEDIRSNLQEASRLWSIYIDSDATIEIVVDFKKAARGEGPSGASRGHHPIGRRHRRRDVLMDGAAYTIKTGAKPSGGEPGIRITLPDKYLKREMWFDPDPASRSVMVERGRFDAVTVFLHELAHGLGMNGRLDRETGKVRKGDAVSSFDEHVAFDGGDFFFRGPSARKEFGGKPIPLSRSPHNNYHHLGEALRCDLMTGMPWLRGWRYHISRIDLAILKDVGVPIRSGVL